MHGRNWQRRLERRLTLYGRLTVLVVALAAIVGVLGLFGIHLPLPPDSPLRSAR